MCLIYFQKKRKNVSDIGSKHFRTIGKRVRILTYCNDKSRKLLVLKLLFF